MRKCSNIEAQRRTWIQDRRLRREAKGFNVVLLGKAGEMPLCAHRTLPCAQCLRVLTSNSLHLRFEQFRGDCCDDAACYFVLNGKKVSEVMIVPVGPDMRATLHLDELGSNANAITCSAHAAFQDVTDAEVAADTVDVDGLS